MKVYIEVDNLVFDAEDSRCEFIHCCSRAGAGQYAYIGSSMMNLAFITVYDKKTGKGKRYFGAYDGTSAETTASSIRQIMERGGKWPPEFNQSWPWPEGLEPYE